MTEPRVVRLARWLAWLSAAGMAGAWAIVALLGDRVWWALPFLYGPRWVAVLLFAGLLPALGVARRTAWQAGLPMLLIYIFGLLDFHLPFGALERHEAFALRVMELNAGAGSFGPPNPATILTEIGRVHPDVVVIAECSQGLADAIGGSQGWQVRRSITSLCLASRLGIVSWEERDPMDFWKAGGSGAIARALLATPAGMVRIGLVHLETPRDALDNYGDLSTIPTLGNVTRENMAQRDWESRVARQWIFRDDALPTIVAGDFNLPTESAIYDRHWGDLRNAFSRSGFGMGVTKQTRRWGIRIDHILTTGEIVTDRTAVGRAVGSDHLPFLADLSLPLAQRTRSAR